MSHRNRISGRIKRFNTWLAEAGYEDLQGNTLTRVRANWKSLSRDHRLTTLKRIGFLREDGTQAEVGYKPPTKKDEKASKPQKKLKDHAGHRPKGKKGK